MIQLYCAFKKINKVEEFFPDGNLKRGNSLRNHVFASEQQLFLDGMLNQDKCVSQVKDDVVDDIDVNVNS